MNEFYLSIIGCLRDFVNGVTAAQAVDDDFKRAKTHPLACRAFVRKGAAQAAAVLHGRKDECALWGTVLLNGVYEKDGWLLFDFADGFYNALCEKLAALPCGRHAGVSADNADPCERLAALPRGHNADKDVQYLINRLSTAARHGRCPCPQDARVRRTLWDAFCDFAKSGGLSAQTQRAVLSMSHHLLGRERVGLEQNLGGVALAMLGLIRAGGMSQTSGGQ